MLGPSRKECALSCLLQPTLVYLLQHFPTSDLRELSPIKEPFLSTGVGAAFWDLQAGKGQDLFPEAPSARMERMV